jgi:hypothetical protein
VVLLEAARGVARREGLALPGYAHALARLAAPCVEVARRLDREEQPTLLAVERDGDATLPGDGAPRTLRFRADRVDEVAGVRRFTDWKTGKPKLEQRTPAARDAAYATRLAHGELLQGHVYALTGGSARYVYLAPEADDALRILEVDAGGAQQAAFETSVGTLLDASEQGAFPPRVREPGRDEEPRACQGCEVKQACVRGDSGVRRRLAAWADATGEDAPALERAALALWRLPEASA